MEREKERSHLERRRKTADDNESDVSVTAAGRCTLCDVTKGSDSFDNPPSKTPVARDADAEDPQNLVLLNKIFFRDRLHNPASSGLHDKKKKRIQKLGKKTTLFRLLRWADRAEWQPPTLAVFLLHSKIAQLHAVILMKRYESAARCLSRSLFISERDGRSSAAATCLLPQHPCCCQPAASVFYHIPENNKNTQKKQPGKCGCLMNNVAEDNIHFSHFNINECGKKGNDVPIFQLHYLFIFT